MKTYTVNANFTINVLVEVEAESEEEAERKAVGEIYCGNYETGDPVCAPKINWAELDEDA